MNAICWASRVYMYMTWTCVVYTKSMPELLWYYPTTLLKAKSKAETTNRGRELGGLEPPHFLNGGGGGGLNPQNWRMSMGQIYVIGNRLCTS